MKEAREVVLNDNNMIYIKSKTRQATTKSNYVPNGFDQEL